MKKFLISLCFILLLILPGQVFAQEGDWRINTFESQLDILKTGEVVVKEDIEVNYGNLQKHGIFRDLPYVYETEEGKLYTEVLVENVLRDGRNEKYTISKNDYNLEIKIGDPDKTISGYHTYTISYTVKGVISSYKDFDELYWNATGEWPVPIDAARLIIRLPEDSILQSFCYVGYKGSEDSCDSVTSSKSALFQARNIKTGEQMSVAAGFKKNTVPIITVQRPKTFFEKVIEPQNIISFLTPVICGIVFLIYHWYKNGRDFWRKGKHLFEDGAAEKLKPVGAHETIVVEYTPPDNLRPAELGVLVDERADTLDVTATLIDLAARGYFTITEIPKKWMFGKIDYQLHMKKEADLALLPYEKTLIKRLFGSLKTVKISELKNTFYDDLKIVKDELYEHVVKEKLFSTNPEKIRSNYLIIGFFILFGSTFGIFVPALFLQMFFAGLLILGIIIIVFSRFMPRRTGKGRELYRRAKGYYEFISHVEKYRQQFFERKNMFNEVLPYAIVFGLTEKFANAMKDIGVKPNSPSWYTSAHAFNIVSFGNNINSFSSSLSTAISSAPRSSGSSGGGSSGGGFGGGGGGSW